MNAGLFQRVLWCVAVALSTLAPSHSVAQPGMQLNPVYVDDSPSASDTLARVGEMLQVRNTEEVVRVLQVLLDEQADRVIVSANDPEVFVSVRSRVLAEIKSRPELLDAYRRLIGPRADAALAEGNLAGVERSMILTRAGFESALRLGQRLIEDARFEAARFMLEQLIGHPDATGPGTAQLSDLYGLLARCIDRPSVRARSAELRSKAGQGGAQPGPVAWPDSALDRGRSLLRELPSLQVPDLISKPLWTASLGPAGPPPDPSSPIPGNRGNPASISVFARDLTMLPTSQGDWVFVNDGNTISAWDRFTLTPRWSYSAGTAEPTPVEEDFRGRGLAFRGRMTNTQRTADSSTVSVLGRTLVAAVGRGSPGSTRDGDDRLVAIDIPTGRALWSVTVRSIDPAIAEGTVRGPVMLEEGLVIAAVRKWVPDRRLMSLALVGLDMRTGETRWVRPVASTGQMPWLGQPGGADAIASVEGVAYRADQLGVIAAVETGTGRILWIRRANVETGSGQNENVLAWHLNVPIHDGASILTISPDNKRVVRLDRDTGAMLASRDARDLGEPAPRYLLKTGDRLACVDDDCVRFVSLPAFDTAEIVQSKVIEEPGIRGRVSPVGGRLLAPTRLGAVVIDPVRPGAEPAFIALEESGNVLALDNQLVVVDDGRLHSYLLWEVAESLLTERMRADPANPSPAVTFAELAYRAGKPGKIAPAVDAAMAALRAVGSDEASDLNRQRLFDALHVMLNHALEPEGGAAAADGSRPRALSTIKPITDRSLLEVLGARLGDLAHSADERLAHTLVSGRLAERADQGALAAEKYQSVLDDAALASATWRGPAALVRGELEAARRIETLIARRGPSVYAAQEARAAADVGALGPSATPEQLEALAMRYPVATVSPGLWLRAAELHRAADQPNKAASALDAGLRVAQRVAAPDPRVVGEIAGQLISDLRSRKQLLAAANVLRIVRARFAQVTLTAAGQPLDADRLGAELADRLAATMRWPRVGALINEDVQVMPGWTAMTPVLRDSGPIISPMLVLEKDDEVGVWSAPTGHGVEDAQLVRAWSMKLEGRDAKLIKSTPDAAYFLVSDGQGEAVVHKVAIGESRTRWSSESTGKLFAGDQTRGLQRAPGVMADAFNTPTGGQASPTDLIVAMDDRSIVLVQRGGRAAGIDTETGETLWNTRTLVSRVYDADLVNGVLAVAGDQVMENNGRGAIELQATVQALEARTGHALQRVGDLPGHPRWIKVTDSGNAVLGLDQAVVCVDLATGQVNWRMDGPDGQPMDAAWVFGDQVIMLAPSRTLYFASISSGRVRPQPLEVPRSHLERTRLLEVFPLSTLPNTGFGVASNQGLAIFDGEGELKGVDGMGGEDSMVPPKPSDSRAVTIQTLSDGRGGDGLLMFQTRQFDTRSAALLATHPVLLGARPSDLMLMDGRVAVTAGNVTVVYRAPAKK